jgi:hypothetical protein
MINASVEGRREAGQLKPNALESSAAILEATLKQCERFRIDGCRSINPIRICGRYKRIPLARVSFGIRRMVAAGRPGLRLKKRQLNFRSRIGFGIREKGWRI